MEMYNIVQRIEKSINLLATIKEDSLFLETIEDVAKISAGVLHNGGRILFCGNGGSAADAQHIAAELSGRFKLNRQPFDAEALHVNTSYLTAVANDFGFDVAYERLVQAKGRAGDMLFAISTSGKSKNILNAIYAAHAKNMIVVGMTGNSGGDMLNLCDYIIRVPSDDTPMIQEIHIMIGHILCERIELLLSKEI